MNGKGDFKFEDLLALCPLCLLCALCVQDTQKHAPAGLFERSQGAAVKHLFSGDMPEMERKRETETETGRQEYLRHRC
jgi:hypothetical protein